MTWGSGFLTAVLIAGFGCGGQGKRTVQTGGGSERLPSGDQPVGVGELSAEQLLAALEEASETADVKRVAVVASELRRRHKPGDDQGIDALLDRIIDETSANNLEQLHKEANGAFADRVAERVRALTDHRAGRALVGAKKANIAILLPLSGTYASIGVELRAALTLAAADTGVPVQFIDTKGTEDGAETAVGTAAGAGANTLIGPVGDKESRAAARAAVRRGLAIGLLSPADDGSSVKAQVFRLWPSRESEAREAASIAVELGFGAPAILAPRDELGRSVAKAFTEAAKAAGATSVRTGFYDPTATELEPDLKRFLGLEVQTNQRLRRHLRRYGRKKGWKTFSPDVDFDLLYIPDTYDRAALVASYLPFFNVELRAGELVDAVGLRRKHGGRVPSVVQLLGSREWNHPSLITRGGAAVDGALIMDACVGGAGIDYPDDDSELLGRRLRRAIGKPPSRLALQAYDTGKLLFDRVRRHGKGGAEVFARAESKTGACGPAEVDQRGQLLRSSVLLRVDGGDFTLHEW